VASLLWRLRRRVIISCISLQEETEKIASINYSPGVAHDFYIEDNYLVLVQKDQ